MVQPAHRAGTSPVVPFGRALSQPDQDAFDHLFACITQHVQGDAYLSRPPRFEAILLAVLLEHEKRIADLVRNLQTVQADARGI
jgi:hypothetical protein